MPFIVKATYRNETRKFTFPESHFPTFKDLYHQLYRVFAFGNSYYLSKLLFSPQEGTRILIGMEAHSAAEYDAHVAPFKNRYYPNGCLTFAVYDETPHKVPVSRVQTSGPGTSIHPIPPVPPIPFFAPPPPPPPPPPPMPPQPTPPRPYFGHRLSTPPPLMDVGDDQSTSKRSSKHMQSECCSVAEGKREVRSLMDNFVRDFTRVMATTFGEDTSFFDPLASPYPRSATPHAPTPIVDMEASLPIPGSFIQPRPHSPITVDDEVEKSQSPPHLEPSQMLHPNTWCDFCGKQIKGLRFKCQECTDYDLCANCIVVNQALDKHNANQTRIHGFSTISPPTRESSPPRAPLVPIIPQWQPLRPPTSSSDPVVHVGISCDMCQETIVGNRHKCLDCPDYDLCDKCIDQAPTQHPLHQFLKLETPGRVIVHTVASPLDNPQAPASHNARCNLCDSRIVGDRYKCTNCPDFDACDGCFAITPEQHPRHAFVKVVNPSDIMVPRNTVQPCHPAICDCCNTSITGVRYKCMHAECPDFDLCENCEALPIPVHPMAHPLLKVKTVGTRIPSVPRRDTVTNRVEPPAPVPVPNTPPIESTPIPAPSSPLPPVSTPVERLHAIRMQAERRLSARMQQLQRYSFSSSGSTVKPNVDPIIEERLLKEHREAEEKALAAANELVELEKARQKKHEETLRQAQQQEDEEVQQLRTMIVDGVQVPDRGHFDAQLKQWLVKQGISLDPRMLMVDTKEINLYDLHVEVLKKGGESSVTQHNQWPVIGAILGFVQFAASGTEPAKFSTQVANHLMNVHRAYLSTWENTYIQRLLQQKRQQALTAANLMDSIRGQKSPKSTFPEEPALERPPLPEMAQRKPSFFGSPFIQQVESPLQGNFISDNNIPDGHVFPAGSEFVKSWRVKNAGLEAWGEGTELVFVGGMRLGAFEGAPTIYEVGVVASGEQIDVCAGDMKAPDAPGRFSSHWRLRDPQGRQFGPKMWCDIEVLETVADHSQHSSLVNSAVVMPETAPQQLAPSVSNAASAPSSPVTVPSSILTSEGDASSVGSVSLVDHNDSDWDDVQYASPPPSPPMPSRTPRVPRSGDDADYLVLYDSSDSSSEEA